MTMQPYHEPLSYPDGKPMRSAVDLRPYGCTCRVVYMRGTHEGVPYDRVTYIDPDCQFRDRHLGQEKP